MTLENSLANYSFLTLLASMIFYWIETSFSEALLFLRSKNNTASFANSELLDSFSFAKSGVILSNLLLGLLLLIRWKESGHFPLSNLYESLMFLSWCFTGLHLYIDKESSSTSLISEPKLNKTKFNNDFVRKILGSITTPSALLTNAFATFTLPKEMQEASPLVPALQSNWLMMHVTVMILSYAALILGSLMSIAFLILTKKKTMVAIPDSYASPSESEHKTSFVFDSNSEARSAILQNNDLNLLLILDNLSYRILGIGFPLLTIGILSGAVWANEAWGSYWSWDPKETWALLTWLIFAIYLHTRISKGWAGKKPAIIASFGFLIVWMCYLGVNLLGEGLHSYGWIINT